jgi:hypothetical protein
VPSYPIEVEEDKNFLNASYVLDHSESFISGENIEKMVSDNDKLLQVTAFLQSNQSQSDITDTSICECCVSNNVYIEYE